MDLSICRVSADRAKATNGIRRDEKAVENQVSTAFKNTPGGVLLSHTVSRAVPSALEGLTTVFGMGTGVSPPP